MGLKVVKMMTKIESQAFFGTVKKRGEDFSKRIMFSHFFIFSLSLLTRYNFRDAESQKLDLVFHRFFLFLLEKRRRGRSPKCDDLRAAKN